eukprot:TRINITY_DN1157_c0_g1_i1.p1 TRINITY_DN1157_c0_g1~~TRINITY_DN1157_c0_g1_i1.p1  ORF type:complete len:421 (-),score=153.87 TRINITY_DN1157_c0_g1_i1:103-1365(-)
MLQSVSFPSAIKSINHRNGSVQSRTGLAAPSRPFALRNYSVITIKVPSMADSITEGTLQSWEKKVDDVVKTDDLVARIETDKVTVDIRAPQSGKITEQFGKEGETVLVGADFYKLDTAVTASDAAPKKEAPKEAPKESTPSSQSKQAPKQEAAPAPKQEAKSAEPPKKSESSSKSDQTTLSPAQNAARQSHRVKMTRIRQRISQRLIDAQTTYAMLTTFNEVDMSGLMALRTANNEEFSERHGTKLGFMSPFVKACTIALKEVPGVNAVIDDASKEIIYHDYVDISVAVATPKGLVVPVVRDCDTMSFAQIEKTLAGLAKKGRDDTLTIEEMTGGTFTISNGGVYGSLMGTPIINPPQSAILGMHAVNKRPVVVNDQIVIRPMMYIALTYDHRLIDGREAVTFLKRVKELIEDPQRMLLA